MRASELKLEPIPAAELPSSFPTRGVRWFSWQQVEAARLRVLTAFAVRRADWTDRQAVQPANVVKINFR